MVSDFKVEHNRTGDKLLLCPQLEPATISCLVEYAYTGEFQSPNFCPISDSDKHRDCKEYEKKPVYKGADVLRWAWENFAARQRDYGGLRLYCFDSDLDEPEALCTVAKVFDLAYDYEIEDLQSLSLYKICRLLVCGPNSHDAAEFLAYCSRDVAPDALLDIAVEYATLKVVPFADNSYVSRVMEKCPKLALEIVYCQAKFIQQYAEAHPGMEQKPNEDQ